LHKLYIAGDSYASLDPDNVGNTWSEILSNLLNLELKNIAVCGSSNESIALQLSYINTLVTENDYVIVFLTDHLRKLLFIDPDQEMVDHPFTYYKWFNKQIKPDFIKFNKPILESSIIYSADDKRRHYFKEFHNIYFQHTMDTYILLGAITELAKKTSNYIVCSGGFGNLRYDNVKINCSVQTLLLLNDSNFYDLNVVQLDILSQGNEYINHLDNIAHQKVARLLYKKLLAS